MPEGLAPPIAQISSVVLQRVADDDLALPSLPWALQAASAALSESPFAPRKVAQALQADPLAMARLIRRANSAPYSDGTAVNTAYEAASRLGARIIRIFLDDAGVDRIIVSKTPKINDARRRVWEHCVAVGLVARDLAGFVFGQGQDQVAQMSYVGGLLHDLGKPVVAALLLDAEKRLAGGGTGRWLNAEDWTKVVCGSHATVGRLLAVKWGLPTTLRQCIAEPYSYDPWKKYAVCNFVTLANAAVERLGLDIAPPPDEAVTETVLREGARLLEFPDAKLMWATRDLRTRVADHIGEWNMSAAVQA